VGFQKLIKTLKESGCEIGADGDDAAVATAPPTTPKAPKTPKAAKTPKTPKPAKTPKTTKTAGSEKKTPKSRKKNLVDESDDERSSPSKRPKTTAGEVKSEVWVKTEDEELIARVLQRVEAMDRSAFTDEV
jgi:hypothetical protein